MPIELAMCGIGTVCGAGGRVIDMRGGTRFWDSAWRSATSNQIAYLIIGKVLEQAGFRLVLVIQEDLQDFASSFVMEFLRIP